MRKLTVSDNESSNVRSITFDVDDRGAGHLDVEFSSGGSYRYANCTIDDFVAACLAPSLGKWVQATLVRQPIVHPHTNLTVDRATTVVDAATTAIRTIASLRPQSGSSMAREIVEFARNAALGNPPPSLPPDFPQPLPVDGFVRWREAHGQAVMHLGALAEMTPDQATAVGHAILVAALEARAS